VVFGGIWREMAGELPPAWAGALSVETLSEGKAGRFPLQFKTTFYALNADGCTSWRLVQKCEHIQS
jgi:hypothetical protein